MRAPDPNAWVLARSARQLCWRSASRRRIATIPPACSIAALVRAGALLAVALAGCAGGQTGSEGAAVLGSEPPRECSADLECTTRAEAQLAGLRAPRVHGALQLLSAQCTTSPGCGAASTSACMCSSSVEGSQAQVLFMLAGPSCALYGRGLECLLPAEQVPACTPGGCECQRACNRALALRDGDDARPLEASVRLARCVAGRCRSVVQLPGGCYSGDVLAAPGTFAASAQPFACDQSEAALLASSSLLAPAAPQTCGTTAPAAVVDAQGQAGAGACGDPAAVEP